MKSKERMEKNREKRKAGKERKRLLKDANKALILTPKKTFKSMGLISFDPSGVFCFEEGRWLKTYVVTGNIGVLVEASLNLKSRLRITEKITPAKGEPADEEYYVSLVAEGDIYDSIRKQFEADEEVLQEMIGVRALTVDEVLNVIDSQLSEKKRSLSYASFVRAKKDLFKEIFPEVKEKRDYFQVKESYGMSMFIMEYPSNANGNALNLLKELGCPAYVTFDFVRVSKSDKEDYVRTLEKRYARSLSPDRVEDFLNVSGEITIICDSKDAMEIVKGTVKRIFERSGFLVANVYGGQRECFLSQVSLGLLDYKNLRNVSVETMNKLMRRQYVSNQNEIRTDEDV